MSFNPNDSMLRFLEDLLTGAHPEVLRREKYAEQTDDWYHKALLAAAASGAQGRHDVYTRRRNAWRLQRTAVGLPTE